MRLPWQHLGERVRADVQKAELRLHEARAQRAEAERQAQRSLFWLAENHISPKLRMIYREGRR